MTSVLVEKATLLQQQVAQLVDTQAYRDKLDRVSTVTQRLSAVEANLSVQTELMTAMREHDPFSIGDVHSRAEAIAASLDTTIADIASDQRKITPKLSDDINGLSQDMRALVERHWSLLASQAHVSDIKGLLQALTEVEIYRTRAIALLAQTDSLERALEGKAVSDATGYRTFQQQLQSVLAAVADLEIGDKPGLEDFLKDAAAGRATLARLTPPIIGWIQEEGLLNHFVVRPGGSNV